VKWGFSANWRAGSWHEKAHAVPSKVQFGKSVCVLQVTPCLGFFEPRLAKVAISFYFGELRGGQSSQFCSSSHRLAIVLRQSFDEKSLACGHLTGIELEVSQPANLV